MYHRLFLAIPLPESYLDAFSSLAEQYNIRGVGWTARENLHITLYFLGDIDEEEMAKMVKLLNGLKEIKSFDLDFRELAFAPPARPPRMIWAEFSHSQNFDRLVTETYRACKDFISAPPARSQIPHITLARFKDWADFREIQLPQLALEPIQVKKVKLMSSDLTPQGPIYREVQSVKLKT